MNASKLTNVTVHEVQDEQERKVTLTEKFEKPARASNAARNQAKSEMT